MLTVLRMTPSQPLLELTTELSDVLTDTSFSVFVM